MEEERHDTLPDTSSWLGNFFSRVTSFKERHSFFRTMREGMSGGLGTMRAKGGDVPSTKDRGRGDK